MNDHKRNSKTWLAHAITKVNLETLKNGHYPSGQKLTAKDVLAVKAEIQAASEFLKAEDCEVPELQEKEGDQLQLLF